MQSLHTYTPFHGTEKGERREKQTKRNKKNPIKRGQNGERERMRLRGKVEERTQERERQKGKEGKTQKRNSHNKRKKNGKGPDALDWFLHDQSLTGGDGEARSLLYHVQFRDQHTCPEDKLVMPCC